MTKWKDITAGGYEILWREEIKEGERKGWSCGVVDTKESEDSCIWTPNGSEIGTTYYNLVPAEPEVVHTEYYNVESAYSHRYIPIRVTYYSDDSFTVTKEEV